jgi:lysozyme
MTNVFKKLLTCFLTQKEKTYMYDLKRLTEQLKTDEGVVYRIYNDHLGNPTFGVGHLVTKNDPEWGLPPGTPVSEKRVWQAFEDDLSLMIEECEILFGQNKFYTYPSIVQEILVNQMFNMGRRRLSTFVKYRAALEKRDWKSAAREGRDSLWYGQVRNRAERLMRMLEEVKER